MIRTLAFLVIFSVFCVCLSKFSDFFNFFNFCNFFNEFLFSSFFNGKYEMVINGLLLGNMAIVIELSERVTIHAFVRHEIFDVF